MDRPATNYGFTAENSSSDTPLARSRDEDSTEILSLGMLPGPLGWVNLIKAEGHSKEKSFKTGICLA